MKFEYLMINHNFIRRWPTLLLPGRGTTGELLGIVKLYSRSDGTHLNQEIVRPKADTRSWVVPQGHPSCVETSCEAQLSLLAKRG